jgi:hypothetical protein
VVRAFAALAAESAAATICRRRDIVKLKTLWKGV